ncbi:MAG: M60 family metallopeptidase [Proteobacteria bacterium]|nr:M60 family metallopeptidase [Pseudomonadota bacterium]
MHRPLPVLLLLVSCVGDPSNDGIAGDTGLASVCDSGLAAQTWGCAYDCTDDVDALRTGVNSVEVPGALPANLVVVGERACPTLLDADQRVLAASSRVGEGRVWVAGHGAYLGTELGRVAMLWASYGDGFALASPSLTTEVGATGMTVLPFDADALDALDGVDLIVLDSSTELSPTDGARLLAFVEDGGGLVTAGQAWWWASSHDTPAAEDYPANAWLARAGIVITAEPSWSAAVDTPLMTPAEPWLHHRFALTGMAAVWDGELDWNLETQRAAVDTSLFALGQLPLSREDYYEVAIPYSDAVGPVVPTEASPVDATTQLPEVLAARVQGKLFAERPAAEVGVYGGVDDFPGAVTSTDRVIEIVTVLASYDGRSGEYVYSGSGADVWRSTGLYAAPGEVVSLSVPGPLVDSGASVLIGPWTDTLWGKDRWSRFPEVTRTERIDAAEVEVASAFGGPIYVRIPAGLALGEQDVQVTGAVPMAHYVHGSTVWSEVANNPAPWAELESDRFAMTVPAAELDVVSNASELMDFWDEVLGGMSVLEGEASDRPRAERFVVDRQISAGWMHSGYPIMAHLVSAEEVLDLGSLMSNGAWGPFHELGHNHQSAPWILPGTTETTCNLFSVYASENHSGVDRSVAHGELTTAARQGRIDAYVNGGRNFSDWSVWTALETYLQLEEAFGWDLYANVFAAYRLIPDGQLPTTDQERIDLWAEMTSAEAGVDLGPFYIAWGFPLSQATLDDMALRPAWTADPMNP